MGNQLPIISSPFNLLTNQTQYHTPRVRLMKNYRLGCESLFLILCLSISLSLSRSIDSLIRSPNLVQKIKISCLFCCGSWWFGASVIGSGLTHNKGEGLLLVEIRLACGEGGREQIFCGGNRLLT
ncbi:unnamed protein product [Ilex paraguariensis]|uniref:Transmembrane protein n=1 Tax=Ilex paraguariensis TaxID=185542 RepID=A0ABC8RJT4_9AQUA